MDAPRSLPQPASYSDGIPAPQISAAHPPPSTTTWGWRQACEMPGEHDLSQCVTHKKNNDLPACLWGTKRPQNVEASEWSQVNCRMRATVAAKRGGMKVAGSSEQDDPRVATAPQSQTACPLSTFADHVTSVCGSSARTEYTAFTSLPPTVHAGEPSKAKTHPERFLEG